MQVEETKPSVEVNQAKGSSLSVTEGKASVAEVNQAKGSSLSVTEHKANVVEVD